MSPDRPRFCPQCAGPLEQREIAGEFRNHWICGDCGYLHYVHPMVVTKCFVACGNRLLWVRRGIEPLYGLWAVPGGFLESGETLVQGAVREVREEAGVLLDPRSLKFYMLGTVTFINQVHIAFRTTVDSLDCRPGVESLECRFFTRDECPWDKLAHPEVKEAMEQAYEDLDTGVYGIWHSELSADGYQRGLVSEV